MRVIIKMAVAVILLLADIIILSSCLYMLVSFGLLSSVTILLPMWIGLVLISYIVNLLPGRGRIGKKGKIVWNLLWMVISFCVCMRYFVCEPMLPLLRVIVGAVLVGIEAHGYALSKELQKPETCLLSVDTLVIVFVLFLAGSRHQLPGDISKLVVLGYVDLILLIVSLIILRTSNNKRRIVKGTAVQNRKKMLALLAVILGGSAIICLSFFNGLRQTSFGIKNLLFLLLKGLRELLHLIEKMLLWMSRLLGISEGEVTIGDRIGYGQSPPPSWEGMNETLLIIILTAVIVAIVSLLIKTVGTKQRESKKSNGYIIVLRNSYQRVKISWLRKLIEKILLFMTIIANRKTFEGLLLIAQRKGRAVGASIKPRESWATYLRRLADYGGGEVLIELADLVQRYLYRGTIVELKGEQYLKYIKALKSLKKKNIAKEPALKTSAKSFSTSEKLVRDALHHFSV